MKSRRNQLIIEPINGLGNRLRALASAYVLSKETSRELVVIWTHQDSCDCDFEDLYEIPEDCTFHSSHTGAAIIEEGASSSNSSKQNYFFKTIESSDDKICDIVCRDPTIRIVHFTSFTLLDKSHETHPVMLSFLRNLRPSANVQEILQNVSFDTSQMIGLHIRIAENSKPYEQMGDPTSLSYKQMEWFREGSSFEAFRKIVNLEIDKNPRAKFFLASNCEQCFEQMIQTFGKDRIYYIPREYFDRSLNQLYYAVSDFYFLSSTKFFYGSSWSAFSEIVKYIRMDPLTAMFSQQFLHLRLQSGDEKVESRYTIYMFLFEEVFRKMKGEGGEGGEGREGGERGREGGERGGEGGEEECKTMQTILRQIETRKYSLAVDFLFRQKYYPVIDYSYYTTLPLSSLKRIQNCFRGLVEVSYVPPYKLVLPNHLDFEYGKHRVGWKSAIYNLLLVNYVEYGEVHMMNPYFEWTSFAEEKNLDSYDECMSHLSVDEVMPIVNSENRIPAVLLDDWIEFSYQYKALTKMPYTMNFVSFSHDPILDADFKSSNNMSVFMKEKLNSELFYENSVFQEEKENLRVLFLLSTSHKQKMAIQNPCGALTKYVFIEHPLEYENHSTFSIEKYIANPNKKIYFIGWWLRKYDVFIHINVQNHTKVLLMKDIEGYWVTDTVMYQIRRVLGAKHLSNKTYQEKWTEKEERLLRKQYNVRICSFLPAEEYDKIFFDNVMFLDFFETSANNALLECILTNTPVCIKKCLASVDYLGEEYPLFFESLEEAVEKLNNVSNVCEAYFYLKKMDKSKFSYLNFSRKFHDAIVESFETCGFDSHSLY